MEQQFETPEITKKEAEKLTAEIVDLLKGDVSKFWQISERLAKIKNSKGYKFIVNPKTNDNFRTFEEYCLIYFDLARTTAFNYISAKEYVEEHHPDVHPSEHLDYSKIALLNSVNKPEFKEKWKELDEKVFSNSITKRELEEEINNIKKENYEPIDLKKVCSYDKNIFYLAPIIDETLDKNILCIDATFEKIKVCKEHFRTLLRKSILYHPDGREFSLREYSKVQYFPDSFKFVGNPNEIKNQIGNAVSPKMSEYIIKKHIKGNTYIDLFCGCGGFSLGAHNLNKKCIWANDFDKFAIYSFKLNFPETLVNYNDIKKINPKEIKKLIGKVDFIIGGTPCQGFSTAGKKFGFETDPRNQLYKEFIKFLITFKPKQFMMENVPPILEYKDKIIDDFEKIGYNIIVEKVNGLDIGMKQNRTRVFFIGNLKKSAEMKKIILKNNERRFNKNKYGKNN